MSELRLLQVEDSESDADLIVRRLSRAGYEVRSQRVDDSRAMRAALAATAWDLVTCDYQMPAFDAPAALKVLRESGQDIPFIVISGTVGEDVAVALMRAGAHDYLMKGNLKRLGAAVERELREAQSRAERRRAMEELAEREAQLSMAIESTELGVFDHDIVSGKVYYSDLARRHLMAPANVDTTLQRFFESLHPEDRERVKRAVERALRREDSGRFAEQYRLRAPAEGSAPGEERWISAWGRVVCDENGAPSRFVGVVRDITEQKRAEKELQFQLQLTACITEQSADCILLTDLEGRVRFVNPETMRVFGYSSDEFRAAQVHDLLHHHYPDGRPWPASECDMTRDLSTTGKLHEYEEVFFHKDGTPIDVAVSCGPLILEDKRVGVVFTARDIRERKRSERALRQSDARFRRLIEADIVGIMILDGDYILEANNHALKLIGVTRAEISTRKIPWRSVVEQIELCERAIEAVDQTGTIPAFEMQFEHADGTRVPVLFAGVALNPGSDSQVLCFIVDLTERKDLLNQLWQAQKLESIGMLAGGIAHDFNNLLTVILGYSALVQDGLGREHGLTRLVDQIIAAGNRAAGLTRQLLTFSRRNVSRPQIIDLNEVVRQTRSMLGRLIGEHVEIILRPDRGQQSIHVDQGLIEQVILNLAVNARDAMPEGGSLYIETSRVEVGEGLPPSSDAAPGSYVCLSVTDTGTGMTPEVQARLFEPFFTTKEPGKGTGLGLSTVYGIVKQSGGAITVHSAIGMGTSVRVLFPAVSGSAPEEVVISEAPRDGAETVLLVEDENAVRIYIRRVLEAHGYRVLDASHGEDAIMLAERWSGKIDLLLTDVVLPGIKSSDMIARLIEKNPSLVVLRMSGYPDRSGPGLDDGDLFLQKPFRAEQLLRRVREVLDARGGPAHSHSR